MGACLGVVKDYTSLIAGLKVQKKKWNSSRQKKKKKKKKKKKQIIA
jgi:hypothetical protein